MHGRFPSVKPGYIKPVGCIARCVKFSGTVSDVNSDVLLEGRLFQGSGRGFSPLRW